MDEYPWWFNLEPNELDEWTDGTGGRTWTMDSSWNADAPVGSVDQMWCSKDMMTLTAITSASDVATMYE